MDGVQLPQGYSHFEEEVYFLPFSSQKYQVLIFSTSEGWKAESTLESPSHLNILNQPELKTYLHKDTLTNTNNLLKY